MFYLFVALLLIFRVTIDAMDLCEQHVNSACPNDDIPKVFPKTEEELLNTCTPTIEHFECGIMFEKKCNISEGELLRKNSIFLKTIREVCNADTFLHTVTVEGTDECEKPVQSVCPNDDIPQAFPETEEELDNTCTPAIKRFECIIDFEEKCNLGGQFLELGPSFVATIQEICNKDTLLHAAVVNNLKCFSELVKEGNYDCYDFATPEKVKQGFEALIEEGFIPASDNENDTYDLYDCVRTMHFFACTGNKIESRCGTIAKDAYIEILDKMSPTFESLHGCENMIDMLPTIIRLHKLEKEKENEVEEVLKKRR